MHCGCPDGSHRRYCHTGLSLLDTIAGIRQGKPVPFEIAPGGTARTVANQLNGQNVPISDTLFVLLVRLSGNSSGLRAGLYELKAGETPARLLEKITKGIFAMESLTIIEGWKFHQMRQAIAKHPGLNHETADLSERELLKRLGLSHHAGEGLFFPDTYLFKKGTPDILSTGWLTTR